MEDIEMNFVDAVERYIMNNEIENIKEIIKFIKMGINVNKDLFPNNDFDKNLHPLMFIVYIYTEFTNILKQKVKILIQLLIDYGANVNLTSEALSSDGYSACTPLLWLLENGNEDDYTMIQILLENGANPFIQDVYAPMDLNLIDSFKYLINKYRRGFHRLQSIHRGNLTRKKIKTEKAKQKLQATKLPLNDDLLNIIMDNIDQKKYNPSITDRMNLEKAENRLATAKTLNDRLGSQVPLRNLDYDTLTKLSRYL